MGVLLLVLIFHGQKLELLGTRWVAFVGFLMSRIVRHKVGGFCRFVYFFLSNNSNSEVNLVVFVFFREEHQALPLLCVSENQYQ